MSSINYSTLGILKDNLIGLTSTGSDIDNSVDIFKNMSYISTKTEPELSLTNSLQTVTGWVSFVGSVNITESNGVFTFGKSGKYKFDIERGYTNGDTNPTSPVLLTVQAYLNGVLSFERTGIIGAATAGDEEAYLSITSPSILSLVAGDTIEIKVKAEEGTGSPVDTQLKVMQLSAYRIYT